FNSPATAELSTLSLHDALPILARELGWHVVAYPADWRRHGRAAGPIRNQEMADAGADLCIAFPGGRGTADMVRRARAAGIPVRSVPERQWRYGSLRVHTPQVPLNKLSCTPVPGWPGAPPS